MAKRKRQILQKQVRVFANVNFSKSSRGLNNSNCLIVEIDVVDGDSAPAAVILAVDKASGGIEVLRPDTGQVEQCVGNERGNERHVRQFL